MMPDLPVSVVVAGQIATVRIDAPPVNALSAAVRQGLRAALHQSESDARITAVVLICAGRTFIAGANIREFGQPPQEPLLPALINELEAAHKPWVAAMHGTVLGGGLEVALACRYRIALKSTRFGLPEVNLGLMPGAGGTVRLPRLVGPEAALNIIASGKPINVSKALEIGLIDAVMDAPLKQNAQAFAASVANAEAPPALIDRPVPKPGDTTSWQSSLDAICARAGHQQAPKAIAKALDGTVRLGAAEALQLERTLFTSLRDGAQSQALRYLFMAERSATRLDRLKDVKPQSVGTVGVIGGGTMGAGIAAACLLAGLRVTMIERDDAALQSGVDRVSATLDNSLTRKLVTAALHQQMLDSFAHAIDYEALRDADIVIEAVFEDMKVKQSVFKQLDQVTRSDAILASNTSYLDVNELARAVSDPSRVVGLHFFSPAHIMKLLEIVVTDQASDKTLATAFAFGRQLRKITVPAGVCDGFIGNRIMSAYRRACDEMLEDGAMPVQIDDAMRDFGFPMGIFRMQDLAGLDISWAMRKRQAAARDPATRYVHIADRLCEQERFGMKTGRGWYRYEGKKAFPDPEVSELILAESTRKGITRETFDATQIMQRILGVMQAEGRQAVAEGIARSEEAVDVVMTNGYGFPRWRGGPMYMHSRAEKS